MGHHKFWMACPHCEGEHRQGDEHNLQDCIRETIFDHRFRLSDSSDWDDLAADIIDVLKRRGIET